MKIFFNEIIDKVVGKENAMDLSPSAQNISNVATSEMGGAQSSPYLLPRETFCQKFQVHLHQQVKV